MFTSEGIGMDVWVRVADDCSVTCEADGPDLHLRFGSQRGSGLTLVLSESALANLLSTGGNAQAALRTDRGRP